MNTLYLTGPIVMAALLGVLIYYKPSGKSWQDFLDSLSTKGGNILVLFCCVMVFIGVYLHIVHDGGDAALQPVAHDLVVGFGGALLGALSAGASRQQMQDRVDTATQKGKTGEPLEPKSNGG
jgi:hypothetical protein